MDTTHLRSRSARVLTAVALVMSIVLASAFIVVHQDKEPPDHTLTDEQTMGEVLESARLFVRAGKLRNPTGSYLLQSCENADEPPYQGSAYITFDVPSITATPEFFREIARAMKSAGWDEGLPDNRHPGGKALARQGVTAYYYRDPDVPGRGVLQIYGVCGNVGDHRGDTAGFIDITDRLVG